MARRTSKKRLIYAVAVQSLDAAPLDRTPQVEKGRSRMSRRSVSRQVFRVTNTGQGAAVYRLKVRKRRARVRLLNDLIFVPAGKTKRVVVWAHATGPRAKVRLKAIPLSVAEIRLEA